MFCFQVFHGCSVKRSHRAETLDYSFLYFVSFGFGWNIYVLVIFSAIESTWDIVSRLKPSLSKVLRWVTTRFGEKLFMVEMVSEQIAVSNFLTSGIFQWA